MQSVETTALVLASVISFSASYLLSYAVLEFLFFAASAKSINDGKLLKKE